MTMQHDNHPHDERVAALAGGDPEVAGDPALREHVASCGRCGPMVDELARLRVALAELPDLAPSRPIQLIPPVPADDRDHGPLRWLRALTGPVLVAGAGLALVGAVGLGGLAAGGMAASGGANFQDVGRELDAGAEPDALEGSPRAPAYAAGQTPSPAPEGASDEQARSTGETLDLTDTTTPLPWLIALLAGVALVVIGLVLRFAIRPRAG